MWRRVKSVKGIERYKPPVICQVSLGDVTHSIRNMGNNVITTLVTDGSQTYHCDHSLLLLLFNCSVVSDALQSHELQHTRLPHPSLSYRVCPSSCPLVTSQCMHMSNHLVSISKTNIIVCQLYFSCFKRNDKKEKKETTFWVL